jgi:hypothetical protein
MARFLAPLILIGLSVAIFFTFTSPMYNEITAIKAQIAQYNEALDNSKNLENERDKLTKKYNAIDPNNIAKLQKLLPNNVDNIRLILEIEGIAAPYGMTLKDVKYDSTDTPKKTTAKAGTPAGAAASGAPAITGGGGVSSTASNKDYGTWNLEFSTEGTYSNFLNFLKDLEHNLRIVDVSTIDFSSDSSSNSTNKNPLQQVYKYNVKFKTYWLKN